MPVLHRMILWRLLGRTGVVFAFAGGIVIATQVLNQLLRLIEASDGLIVLARLAALFVPTVAVVILPLSFLVALAQTYDAMEEASEITAARAAGAGPAYLLCPAFVAAAAVAALVLTLSLWAEPWANRRVQAELGALRLDALQIMATDGALRRVGPGLFVRGLQGDAPGDADAIEDIVVIDRRQPQAEVIYLARSARLTVADGAALLELENGSVTTHDGQGRLLRRVAFGRYATQPGLFLPEGTITRGPRQAGTARLLARLRAGDLQPPGQAELVRRGTDWLYPPAFVALAAAARLAGAGRGGAWPRARLPLVIGTGIALRLAGLAALGSAGTFAGAAAAVALPLGALAVGLVLTVLGAPRRPRPAVVPPVMA